MLFRAQCQWPLSAKPATPLTSGNLRPCPLGSLEPWRRVELCTPRNYLEARRGGRAEVLEFNQERQGLPERRYHLIWNFGRSRVSRQLGRGARSSWVEYMASCTDHVSEWCLLRGSLGGGENRSLPVSAVPEMSSSVNDLIAYRLRSRCRGHETRIWNGKGTGTSSVWSSPNCSVQVHQAKAGKKQRASSDAYIMMH